MILARLSLPMVCLVLAAAFSGDTRADQPRNTIIIDNADWIGCDDNGPTCVYHPDDKCKVGCEFESTKRAIGSVCSGQSSCTFSVTNEWFGAHDRGYADPAGGHKKILLLKWTC